MEDDRDILNKADALLRRHAAPRGAPVDQGDVPLLTELITPGGHARILPDDDFTRELVAEVVNAVQARLAQDLERRLTQQVLAEVQASVAATLADLRQDIANAVGDAVAEALSRRPHR
jgi:hypothetical protein